MIKYEFKIGDCVSIERYWLTSQDKISYGIIYDIRKDDNGNIMFYCVREHDYKFTFGWSYNIFPNGDKIKLDIERTRDGKIKSILKK